MSQHRRAIQVGERDKEIPPSTRCFLPKCLGSLVDLISIPGYEFQANSKIRSSHQKCPISCSFVFLFLKVWDREWQRLKKRFKNLHDNS